MHPFRYFAPFFGAHDFAERAAWLDAGDVLWQGRIEFIGHAVSGAYSDIAHSLEVVSCQIGTALRRLSGPRRKGEEFVVQMPGFLQNFITQIDHSLSVVHASGEIKRAFQADFIAFEGQHVDFGQVAEALISEQDFDARVASLKPGGASFASAR